MVYPVQRPHLNTLLAHKHPADDRGSYVVVVALPQVYRRREVRQGVVEGVDVVQEIQRWGDVGDGEEVNDCCDFPGFHDEVVQAYGCRREALVGVAYSRTLNFGILPV